MINHIFMNAAEKNWILKENIKEIKEFLRDLIPILHKPDDLIVQEGEKGRFFYFIAVGKCTVTFKYFTCQKINLKHGDYFGELALLFNCRRSATIKSSNYTTLAKIEAD